VTCATEAIGILIGVRGRASIGSRKRAALAACVAVVSSLAAAGPALAADEPLPPQGPAPPGANDFSCKPPPRHPYPIVLLHGTYLNMGTSWNAVAPALERLGYCVFALDYGNSPLPGVNGVGDIPKSARQVQTFMKHVLTATGAGKVSFVGHSQGGMMPRYLIKFLAGSGMVDDVVGMSPSSHGTTTPLASSPAVAASCVACTQQVAGSEFMQQLNAGDQTPPPVSYTVIETSHDEVVTPYQSEFLPPAPGGRVTNVLLQGACPADPTEHIGITDDPVAIQWVLNALGRPGPAAPDFKVDCTGAALATYPDSNSVGGGGGAGGGGSHNGGSGSGGASGSGSGSKAMRLVIGHVPRHASTTNRRRLRVAVASRRGTARRLVITVRTRGGKLVGSVHARRLSGRRGFAVRLRRRLARGRYVASARARNAGGKKLAAKRTFALR
jgi:triacylglycerol lipase